MKKLKVAIYGKNGHQIIKKLTDGNYAENRTEWVGAAGISKEEIEAQPAFQQGILKYYNSLEEMLTQSDADVVSLCSPMRSEQAADAIKVLRAGKNVYAEKPSVLSNSQLDEVLRVAEETGKEFHEIADSAYFEPYWTMKKYIASGMFGKIVQVYAQKSYPTRPGSRPQDENADGGLTRQVGIHAARFIEHVVGLKITDAKAIETKLGSSGEGDLHMASSWIASLENGGVASVCLNYFNPMCFGLWGNETLRVFGTDGFIEITDGGQHNHYYLQNGEQGELELSNSDCKDFWEWYVDHLLDGTPMPMTIEEELHPLRIVNNIKENIKQTEI